MIMKALNHTIIFLFALMWASCKQKESSPPAEPADLYTCSMHPQIIRNKPGKCPICGMTLVKKVSTAEEIKEVSLESLLKPANEFIISSIPVTTLQQSKTEAAIQALGTVQYDDRQTGTVSSRIEGRIEKLYVKYRYQYIRKGERILEIYSPELLTAQQNLLFLLNSDPGNLSLINAARQRLLLSGMGTQQITQVTKGNKPLYSVPVYSNYTGYVTDAGLRSPNSNAIGMSEKISGGLSYDQTTRELSIKEGMYLQKGQPVFTIVKVDKALILLNIFAEDQPLVRQGNTVKITPETSSQSFTATISYIEPFYRQESKTLTARVYFNNANLKLPVGSQVRAAIFTQEQNAEWLPADAVLTLGLNQVVFKKEGEGFRAHKVRAGRVQEGKVQILTGLSSEDSVAVNALYLTGNESFIKVK
jgi:Cu(I)/Ag(I) efflux system membrane fusion protein